MGNFLNIVFVSALQIYGIVLILRSLLYFAKMEYSHPIAGLCIRLTQFMVRPIQKHFPCVLGFETVSLFLALIFACASKMVLLFWTASIMTAPWQTVLLGLLLSVFVWLKYVCYVYVGLILVTIVFRLFEPNASALIYLDRIMAPFVRPFKKLKLGLFDFSILPLFFAAQAYTGIVYPLIENAFTSWLFP